MVVTPENVEAEQSDSVSTNGAAGTPPTDSYSQPLVNGMPLTNLEARINAEVEKRRATMQARATYGDDLYQTLRKVVGGYKSLDSKNIPAPARAALSDARALLDKIDAETGIAS
jgi:hypothetical protein